MAHDIDRYNRITKNSAAIIFLGTPHRGVHLDNLLKSILNVSFSNAKYHKDVSPNSQSINEINDAFADQAKGLKLASFWESIETGSAGVRFNNISSYF
jgi:triacylglycerol esterase/lipase EstA (alpha/beta hydrolase family)